MARPSTTCIAGCSCSRCLKPWQQPDQTGKPQGLCLLLLSSTASNAWPQACLEQQDTQGLGSCFPCFPEGDSWPACYYLRHVRAAPGYCSKTPHTGTELIPAAPTGSRRALPECKRRVRRGHAAAHLPPAVGPGGAVQCAGSCAGTGVLALHSEACTGDCAGGTGGPCSCCRWSCLRQCALPMCMMNRSCPQDIP